MGSEMCIRDSNTGTVPDDATIQEAKRHIGYENVRVDGNTVQLLDPEAAIDLGGIAKGYIADGENQVTV